MTKRIIRALGALTLLTAAALIAHADVALLLLVLVGGIVWYCGGEVDSQMKAWYNSNMDSNTAALIMRDKTADDDERLMAACILVGWVSAGGELPDGADCRFTVAEECRDYIRRLG